MIQTGEKEPCGASSFVIQMIKLFVYVWEILDKMTLSALVPDVMQSLAHSQGGFVCKIACLSNSPVPVSSTPVLARGDSCCC